MTSPAHATHTTGKRPIPIIVCDGLVKIYKVADLEVVALQGLDLTVESGEFIAIVGASGSGKSTLLNILGGLDTPSAGTVRVAGLDLLDMGTRQRTVYRRGVIGFVRQQTSRNLFPYLTAVENVELPMVLDGGSPREWRKRAMDLLDRVGMSHRPRHRPSELSGGEQQRVSIAVALANGPSVLFADEPTGELDAGTGAEVFEALKTVNEAGTTIVVVTHDPLVAHHVQRTVAIRDGRTSSEVLRWTEIDEEGQHRIMAEEYVVVDRVGRMQLPHDYMETLNIQSRARLTLDPDHVKVWPDKEKPKEDD